MFLIDVTEWVANWFWDTLDEIFITIFDFFLYSIVGFLYKVFVLLGSMDIFGNSSKAMELYTGFTNRLYGVIAIIMIFILAYQIILFIIDPDKGAKASSQLVKNLVRGIVLVALCPLIFHYASLFQNHVLMDNTIWSVVLGTNSTSSDNPIQAGNSMATMVYMTMFHPTGTEYNDFFDSSGKLKPYKEACNGYASIFDGDLSNDSNNDDGKPVSKSSLRRATDWGLKWGLAGSVFGIGWLTGAAGWLVGGAVDIFNGLKNWITGKEDPKLTACQEYWINLYAASGGTGGPSSDQDYNNMGSYSLTSKAKDPYKNDGSTMDALKIGYLNGASILAGNVTLADEVRDEGTMEYFYLAPVIGGILVFMLVAYSLDMAYRAFKLAFLEMIAPIPILLGVIPKQDGIFKKWIDLTLKTYIDVFVRTFVMAFVVYMINLLPTFISALFEGAAAGVEGGALLKAVVIAFLVIGLLRFAKELPDMVKDIAKSGGGFLKDIDINPKNSFKNAKAGIDNAAKPIGAAAGAIAGGLGALKSSHARNPKQGTGFGNVLRGLKGSAAFAKGFTTGGKEGWKNGLNKGSLTNAVNRANVESGRRELQRDAIMSGIKGIGKPGGVQNLAGILTNGRFGEFKNAWKNNLLDDQLLQAGTIYRDMSNGGKQFFKGADSQIETVKKSTETALEEIKTNTLTQAQVAARKAAYQQQIDDLKANKLRGDESTTSLTIDGIKYKADNQDALIKKLEKERDLVTDKEYYTEYRGEVVKKLNYNQVESEVKNMERAAIRDKQIEETAKVIGEEGYGNVQLYAAKSQELDMRNKDILNPAQLKVQGDELEKAFKGDNAQQMLKFLNIQDDQKRDLGAITQALQKIDFKTISDNGYTYIDGQQVSEEEVRKMVGELVVSISNAEGKVASKVRNIQSSLEGTKIDMVGRSMDNLTPGPPKDGDKGGKK